MDQTRSTLTTPNDHTLSERTRPSRVAKRTASAAQPPSVNRQERSVQSPPASLRGKRRDMSTTRPLWWVGIAFRSQRRDTAELKLPGIAAYVLTDN
jgi:hypothetical protein